MFYRNLFKVIIICLFVNSCQSVYISTDKKTPKSLEFSDKKILIITHDTELTQEYIIYLKNHLRLAFERKGIEAHGVNVRYATSVVPRSIRKFPYIVFKNESSVNEKRVKKGKIQNVQRTVIKEDFVAMEDSITKINPTYRIKIDTKHEHRLVYFTFDSNSQELKAASFDVEILTPKNEIVWSGLIRIEDVSKTDMLVFAKKTATLLENALFKTGNPNK
jgi:hypothetical protein